MTFYARPPFPGWRPDWNYLSPSSVPVVPFAVADPDLSDEPVSLDRARKHCNIDVDSSRSPPGSEDDDDLIDYIQIAREWCEAYCEATFARRQYEMAYTGFPFAAIVLPNPPVVSIDSIAYDDADGVEQNIDPSTVTLRQYGRQAVVMPPAAGWPATSGKPFSVRITYTAGQPPAQCPRPVFWAMLLLIGHMNENHEVIVIGQTATDELPFSVCEMLLYWRNGLSMA